MHDNKDMFWVNSLNWRTNQPSYSDLPVFVYVLYLLIIHETWKHLWKTLAESPSQTLMAAYILIYLSYFLPFTKFPQPYCGRCTTPLHPQPTTTLLTRPGAASVKTLSLFPLLVLRTMPSLFSFLFWLYQKTPLSPQAHTHTYIIQCSYMHEGSGVSRFVFVVVSSWTD